jgi:cytidylate kinase
MKAPLYVWVVGMPGSGRSSLATALARRLSLTTVSAEHVHRITRAARTDHGLVLNVHQYLEQHCANQGYILHDLPNTALHAEHLQPPTIILLLEACRQVRNDRLGKRTHSATNYDSIGITQRVV